jgi:CHAD domain-containing protein
LDTARRRWVLADTGGSELAEVVEDRVDARDLGPDSRGMHWREVEVELGPAGQGEMLDRVERALVKAGARRSAAPSKLARVLSGRLDGTARTGQGRRPDRRLRDGSAGATVLDYLRERAEQIRFLDLGVRREVPDALHRMRVGAREMRSVLQGSGRVLDRAATRALAQELKWLGTELAPARDGEVLRERLVELVADLPDELVLGPVTAHVTGQMARRARQGRERALAALDSDRYLQLHEMIDTLLADPPLAHRAGRPARTELPRSVAKAYRRTAGRMRTALALEPGPDRDLALHEARKAAKRLRYVTELAAPAVGRKARRLRPGLKRVHKLLGAHQDSVVARAVLRELAIQAHLEAADGFTYGLLYGEQAQQAAHVERELPMAWRRLSAQINHGPFRV